MKPRAYLLVTGSIFAAVAVGHLLRLIRQLPVRVGELDIPMWVSVAGLIATGALSAWAFALARRA